MLDMHAHILPQTDDGATDLAMTNRMLRQAAAAGVTRIVATPHLLPGHDPAARHLHFGEASEAARGVGIVLHAGLEVRFDALGEHLGAPGPLCLGGLPFLLMEFHTASLPTSWSATLGALLGKGIQPIIAHVERYPFVQRELAVARDLVHMGCALQVDAQALLLGRLSAQGRTARTLLEGGWIDYVASDAHLPGDYDILRRAHRKFAGSWPGPGALEVALQEGIG